MKKLLSVLLVFSLLALSHTVFAGDMKAGKTCDKDPKECKKMIFEKMSQHGMIGVEGDWIEEVKGLKIKEFYPESNGEKAGLKQGDILTKINNIAMDDKEGIQNDAENRNPGDTVTATVLRDGKETSVTVVLITVPKKAVKKAILEHWEKFHPEFYKENTVKKKIVKEAKE